MRARNRPVGQRLESQTVRRRLRAASIPSNAATSISSPVPRRAGRTMPAPRSGRRRPRRRAVTRRNRAA